MDNSIYTVEDIKRLGDFSILGNIPAIKKYEPSTLSTHGHSRGQHSPINDLYYFEDRMNGYKNKVISLIQSKEPLVDAYRHVRTNLQFANIDASLKRVMITSAIPTEGKTLTVANLAISFAELGKRILVVDCDMRKAHQHVLFNVRKSPGLSDYLARDLTLEKVIYLTHVPNVYVIPAGSTPPNPAEILASNKMSELIRKLEQNFDFVLYDTPPIIAVTDPVLLSKKVGNVVLIIRFGKTSRHLVRDSLNRLKHVNSQVIGVVFNGMERSKGYGYYKYDYSYYQNSYYSEETRGRKKKVSLVG
jgi:polysaccharide biosynthesis transport protein